MDKIEKALAKLSPQEREALRVVLMRILAGDLGGLDVKKLKGRDNVYRVRKGKMRVIFLKRYDGGISVLAVERRSDTTYSSF